MHASLLVCKAAGKLRRPQRTRCGRTTQNAPAYPESQMICLMITNVTLNCSFGISGTRFAGGFRLALIAGCSSFRQRRAATTAVRSHHCRCVNMVPFVRCDTSLHTKAANTIGGIHRLFPSLRGCSGRFNLPPYKKTRHTHRLHRQGAPQRQTPNLKYCRSANEEPPSNNHK